MLKTPLVFLAIAIATLTLSKGANALPTTQTMVVEKGHSNSEIYEGVVNGTIDDSKSFFASQVSEETPTTLGFAVEMLSGATESLHLKTLEIKKDGIRETLTKEMVFSRTVETFENVIFASLSLANYDLSKTKKFFFVAFTSDWKLRTRMKLMSEDVQAPPENTKATQLPEPANMLLFGTGLLGLATLSKIRVKKQPDSHLDLKISRFRQSRLLTDSAGT